jgi:hypothetical protein
VAKILANEIQVRKNVWNGKTLRSISVKYDNTFYGLKGYQANKFVKENGVDTDTPVIKEGQPLYGVVEEYQYDRKDKETGQKTGEKGTGYNFVIYNPVEADFNERIEALETFIKDFGNDTEPPITDEDYPLELDEVEEISVDDIPF